MTYGPISTIFKNSQGNYTVNISTPFPNNKYVVVVTCDSAYVGSIYSQSTTHFQIGTGLPWTALYNATTVYAVVYSN